MFLRLAVGFPKKRPNLTIIQKYNTFQKDLSDWISYLTIYELQNYILVSLVSMYFVHS